LAANTSCTSGCLAVIAGSQTVSEAGQSITLIATLNVPSGMDSQTAINTVCNEEFYSFTDWCTSDVLYGYSCSFSWGKKKSESTLATVTYNINTQGPSTGAIIGGVLGSVAFLVIAGVAIGLVAYYFYNKKKNDDEQNVELYEAM